MKYILIAGDDYKILTEDEKKAITTTPPQELIKVGDNYYYRKAVKIYPEGSKQFNKIKSSNTTLTSKKSNASIITKEWHQWLDTWEKLTPEEKTLIELHNRYGLFLSKTLHVSDLYIGHVDTQTGMIKDSFLDAMVVMLQKVGYGKELLGAIYDNLITFFGKHPKYTTGDEKLFTKFKEKAQSKLSPIDTKARM